MTPQDAIIQAAKEAGEDPAFALAVAERESNFKPTAHSSKTIHGLYQMRGDLRAKYGAGDSDDPLDQARGWMRSLPDIRAQMKSVLGRDPTDAEVYLGHHYGATRAARTLKDDPSTPVDAIFTPQEMSLNPHFARAATIGKLNDSVTADIEQRTARFGGSKDGPTGSPAPADPATAKAADLSSFGSLVPEASSQHAPGMPGADGNDLDTQVIDNAMPKPVDLASFGTPVDQPQPASVPAAPPAPADLSQFGTAA